MALLPKSTFQERQKVHYPKFLLPNFFFVEIILASQTRANTLTSLKILYIEIV